MTIFCHPFHLKVSASVIAWFGSCAITPRKRYAGNFGSDGWFLLRASDGADLGAWRTCGLRYGVEGVPFGVRALSRPGSSAHPDLLFVASMDNPQDGKWQRIAILDASQLSETAGARSPCSILQVIDLDPATYSGPHLLGVDQSTGDLYAALVADHPKSTVLRFACASCGAARVGSPGGRGVGGSRSSSSVLEM